MHHGTRSGDEELRKALLFAVYGFPLLFSSALQEPSPSLGQFASFKAARNCTDYVRSHCLWLSSRPHSAWCVPVAMWPPGLVHVSGAAVLFMGIS